MSYRPFKQWNARRERRRMYERLRGHRIVITAGYNGPYLLDVTVEELYLIWKYADYHGKDKIELGHSTYLGLKGPDEK